MSKNALLLTGLKLLALFFNLSQLFLSLLYLLIDIFRFSLALSPYLLDLLQLNVLKQLFLLFFIAVEHVSFRLLLD